LILITGAFGFIGLHTARAFLDAGEDVLLTRNRTYREPEFLTDDLGRRATVEQVNITNAEQLLDLGRRYRIDGICHLAGPGYSAPSAAADYRINVFGLLNILEAAREWGVKRLTLASSIATYYYGGVPRGPFFETMPLRMTATNPIETYKKVDELLGNHYADRTGIDIAFLRIALVYGPLHSGGAANFAHALTRAAVDGARPEFAGPVSEEDTTDLCYVADCARGIVLLQLAGKLNHRVYNLGDGKATSAGQVADVLEKLIPGSNLRASLQPGRGPSYTVDRYMDLSRITADAGYEPQYSLERGIAEYAEWLKHHEE
jgi:UDP-glucose 4-epimerase